MSLRQLLKRIAFASCLLLVSPAILAAWIERRLGAGEGVFVGLGQLLSLVPGRIGAGLRAAYYHAALEQCSWEVHIGFGSFFTHRGAALGRHVSMGSYCVIGHARIGEGVMMASRISIPSGKRQHFDERGGITSVPRFEQVAIGAGSWVGEGAIVMADVGARCIVAAGAVVAKTMPDACLVAGNPAAAVRELSRTEA